MYSKGEKYNMSPVKKSLVLVIKTGQPVFASVPAKRQKRPANRTTTTTPWLQSQQIVEAAHVVLRPPGRQPLLGGGERFSDAAEAGRQPLLGRLPGHQVPQPGHHLGGGPRRSGGRCSPRQPGFRRRICILWRGGMKISGADFAGSVGGLPA